jgi:hypothetical protein
VTLVNQAIVFMIQIPPGSAVSERRLRRPSMR